MKNNISKLEINLCCGCYACKDVCPQKCISITKKHQGFLYPEIDELSCNECGKCKKVCPILNVNTNNIEPVTCYAAKAKQDVVLRASSGGMFEMLAKQILDKGGKVWGAAFDENLKLKHIAIESVIDLPKLCKSKYIQSNTNGIYQIIKNDLTYNINTLFVGTPCQCGALRNYLQKEYQNLYIVDLICHGVPSQDLFDICKKWYEEKNNCTVVDFTFRNKTPKVKHLQGYKIQLKKNNKLKTVMGLHYEYPFYFGFQKYITLRSSCYTCKYAKPNRSGDITLGDFWKAENYFDIDSTLGVSMVILNTRKGSDFFNLFKDDIINKEISYELAKINNSNLVSPTKARTNERDSFFRDLENESFDFVVNKYLTSKKMWVFKLYYSLPSPLRKLVRKIMDKRMKYE